MRNGFNTKVLQVIDFNALLLNDRLKDRSIGKVYMQYTLQGVFRLSGFVAFDYDRTAFAFTKKKALLKLKEMESKKVSFTNLP